MVLAVEIIGIITMGCFLFILIWGFIIASKILAQLKYKNYILEKLTKNICSLSKMDYISYQNDKEKDPN